MADDTAVREFLDKNNFALSNYKPEPLIQDFINEMKQGLSAAPGCLEMIPTFLYPEINVSKSKRIIVLDAGGTNLRIALMHYDENDIIVMENFQKFPMPGSKTPMSSNDFFEFFADKIRTISHESDTVGYCFSYPCEIRPDGDGKILRVTKELNVSDIEGKIIGQEINAILAKKGHKPKRFVILNDTVATLLAGLSRDTRQQFSTHIGFILGTGTNCAYLEKNHNIKKTSEASPDLLQGINIESGNFNKLVMSTFDTALDKTSTTPGKQILEKMISGAYLGPLSLIAIKEAARTGLFSGKTAAVIASLKTMETKDLNVFLDPTGNLPSEFEDFTASDSQRIREIIQAILERAAVLSAVNICGAAVKASHFDHSGENSLSLTADGTTFYRLFGLKSRVEYYLDTLLRDKTGMDYSILTVSDAPLLGAFYAGLIKR